MDKANYYILIFLISNVSFSCCHAELLLLRQLPQPDLSSLKEDVPENQLSDEFLPAVMIALHYYTDMMQYERVLNNIVTTTIRPVAATTSKKTTAATTTKRATRSTAKPPSRTTPRTTTKRIMTTQRTTTTTTEPTYHTSRPHRPGVFSPEKPVYFTYFDLPVKPEQNYYHKPGVQHEYGITTISEPDWKDKEFLNWFFQAKPKDIEMLDENALQYLDILPKTLLMDIYRDSLRRPALLDLDNVNEFRKIFDDFYDFRQRIREPTNEQMKLNMRIQMQKQQKQIYKKKPPPTRPYVLMVMLYDLLKREAKTKKLHHYVGFSPKILTFLHASAQHTGVYQLMYLLESMLQQEEITTADVVARTKVIIKDLKDERSDAFKTLNSIPPVQFDDGSNAI